MSVRLALALAAALAGMLTFAEIASAQSRIPSSEMPGRERERFTPNPVERFMKPGPYIEPPVVTVAPGSHVKRKRARKRR